MEKRKFSRDALIHCYNRTVDGSLLFYKKSDYLMFFTVICVAARRYNIIIVKLCFMPDHYHISCFCNNSRDLAAFIRFIESVYAQEFNYVCKRKGRLFTKSFGSAPKYKSKSIRTNLIYVDNNPVERYLCKHAEEYRWNFLAYSDSDNPYSEKINMRTAPTRLKNTMQMVVMLNNDGRFLRHNTLSWMFAGLNSSQTESLIDFIISTYSVIDYQFSIKTFGSYENVLISDHATAGSEHDINEYHHGKNDDVYAKMMKILLDEKHVSDIHEIISMSVDIKIWLYNYLTGKTEATSKQIEGFLHMGAKLKD